MTTVNFKGNPVAIKGTLPSIGNQAPDFTFVKSDLTEGKLSDYKDMIKVIIAVPSLDTGVCNTETRRFNELLDNKEGVIGIVISKDLPFAMKRFCETEGVKNIVTASDFRYDDFSKQYNTEMTEGLLKGLSSRAVFVIDKNNSINFVELVAEVTTEPAYENVLSAVDNLVAKNALA
jgi:thiol peroxidase